MPGFYDTGMDRSDGDLVNFITFDTEKIPAGGQNRFLRVAAPSVEPCPGPMIPDRFEPGMSFRNRTELFGDFPLKEMNLGTMGCYRREPAAFDFGPSYY